MAQRNREGRSHFERIVEHMGIMFIYLSSALSSLTGSSHSGKLGMATESLLVMINFYYCTLSKHVIERAREF
jgi:hypothetical protein